LNGNNVDDLILLSLPYSISKLCLAVPVFGTGEAMHFIFCTHTKCFEY